MQSNKGELVKLTSKWNGGAIFVRVFGPKDTIYIFGRWETILRFGESVDFNLPEGQLQLEIKRDGLFGPFIVRPGQIWSNSDVRLLNDKGELVQPDANDVTRELWNNQQNAARDGAGNYAKFSAPTIANGHVYLPTFSSRVVVYGLR